MLLVGEHFNSRKVDCLKNCIHRVTISGAFSDRWLAIVRRFFSLMLEGRTLKSWIHERADKLGRLSHAFVSNLTQRAISTNALLLKSSTPAAYLACELLALKSYWIKIPPRGGNATSSCTERNKHEWNKSSQYTTHQIMWLFTTNWLLHNFFFNKTSTKGMVSFSNSPHYHQFQRFNKFITTLAHQSHKTTATVRTFKISLLFLYSGDTKTVHS